MSDTPRLPGLTLADADWLVQAALAVGTERGFPPLAVAVIGAAGASGAHAVEDEEAVQTAVQRWQESRSAAGRP